MPAWGNVYWFEKVTQGGPWRLEHLFAVLFNSCLIGRFRNDEPDDGSECEPTGLQHGLLSGMKPVLSNECVIESGLRTIPQPYYPRVLSICAPSSYLMLSGELTRNMPLKMSGANEHHTISHTEHRQMSAQLENCRASFLDPGIHSSKINSELLHPAATRPPQTIQSNVSKCPTCASRCERMNARIRAVEADEDGLRLQILLKHCSPITNFLYLRIRVGLRIYLPDFSTAKPSDSCNILRFLAILYCDVDRH